MGRNKSIKATAILVAAALALSLAAFSPSESLAAKAKAQVWRGQIASLQLDDGGRPEWIQSGTWSIKVVQALSAGGKPDLKFAAQITMVKPDGTAAHKHRISNLVLSNYTLDKTALSMGGNATVTMRDGPVDKVPVKVKVTGKSVVAIWVGPEMVDGHFGESPIYGTVSQTPRSIVAHSYSSPQQSSEPETSTSTTSSNPAQTAPSSNSTSTSFSSNSTQSSSQPSASSSGSNSTAPAQSSPATTVISLAARPAMDLYSWFSGSEENPTLRLAANSDATISISNETDRKHKLVIQSQDGTQLAASEDILVGQSGQLTYRPTATGTLQYVCDYHSPMRGTIEVS